MHARCPKHPHCRELHPVGPVRATLLALLIVVVAFATPLTPQAEASSNPGVTFSTALLEVEEGGTNQYTVVLDSEPASNATVAINSYFLGGRDGVSYNPSSLVFTTHNWDTPQTITVTARQDDDDQSLTFNLSHWVTVDDSSFWVGASLTVAVTDDDQEEVKLSTTAMTLFEGESGDYTVWLNRQPENNVTVDPSPTDHNFVFEPSEVTFTPDNWATPQKITITAELDDNRVNDTAPIWHSGGADYGHNRRTILTVTVIDNYEPGVQVFPRTLSLGAGETASYGISMWRTGCTDDSVVTVKIVSDKKSVSVDRSLVTITKANCYERIRVTVSAASDAGNITATLTHTVTGHSHVDRARRLPVTVTDNGATTTTTTSPGLSTEPGADDTDDETESESGDGDGDGGEDPGDNNPGDNNPGDNNPGDNNPGDNNPGDNNPGDNNPGDNNPGDNNPGDNNPGDNNPGDNNPGDNNPGDNNPGDENRVDCEGLDTQTPFVDVSPTSPTASAIACIYALGVTTGTTPTTYSPADNVTRAQMASFLARLYKAITGTDAEIVETPFTDVAATDSAHDDIGRIYGLEITTGTTPTTYSPADNVTRAQMASFLARLYKAITGTDAEIVETPFTDVAATDSAHDDIGRIYGLEITTGTTPTTYSPADNVTRAQMASFLARLYTAITRTDAPITATPSTGTHSN